MEALNIVGKTALITGAARRIGRSIAMRLASDGVNIVIHYRNSLKEAESLAEDLEKVRVKCWLVHSDFEKRAEYENLIDEAIKHSGQLDFLINSASIFPSGTAADISWNEFLRNVLINAWVPFYLGRSFSMRCRKGVIINILDSRIRGYDSKHMAYIMSKKILMDFTKIMALEYAPDIRVNAIAPGLILPPSGKDAKYLDKLIKRVPLKRHGDVANIAETVIFLLKNDFITGETVYIDGAMSLI
jgi:hypothetical protein